MSACGAFSRLQYCDSATRARESASSHSRRDCTTDRQRGSAPRRRIALFRSLFRGREDVYALRWDNDDGWHGYMPAALKDSKAINEVLSAPRSPWQSAYVERVIGTIRRECLDHVIVLNGLPSTGT